MRSSALSLWAVAGKEPAVIAATRKLKAQGYVLALDDFEGRRDYEPLVAQADIVKLDVLGPEEFSYILERNMDILTLPSPQLDCNVPNPSQEFLMGGWVGWGEGKIFLLSMKILWKPLF